MPRSVEARSTAHQLARGELIGRRTRVAVSNDPTLVGLEGTIVDETMHTLTLETGRARRVVAKAGQSFTFNTDDGPIQLDGDQIAYRPEDRTKKAKVDR